MEEKIKLVKKDVEKDFRGWAEPCAVKFYAFEGDKIGEVLGWFFNCKKGKVIALYIFEGENSRGSFLERYNSLEEFAGEIARFAKVYTEPCTEEDEKENVTVVIEVRNCDELYKLLKSKLFR